MATHNGENPDNFKVAIQSMIDQNVPPSDFVIVCDGPLSDPLNKVIDEYTSKYNIFNIVRIDANQGLGHALNVGLTKCKYNFVLRMDSDDISSKSRAMYELDALNNGFDIVGGYISEFEDGDESKIIAIRSVPLDQESIYNFAKKRSPFNHPTIAFKKDFILKAGNYSELRKAQDWELWIRCFINNAKVKNFDTVFVNMRSGNQMRKRRAGKTYIRCINYILKEMKDTKFISGHQYRKLKFLYKCYSIMPLWIKNRFTNSLLRK